MPAELIEGKTMSEIKNRILIVLAVAVLATVSFAAVSRAQAAFAISDFEPVGYMVLLDGQVLADGEVFQSKAAGAFLMLAADLPTPVLVKVRDAQVQTVDLMKVNRRADGTVELLPNATLGSSGAFQVTPDRTGIQFGVGGQRGELREKPPLLGSQNIAGLSQHSPEYRRSADAYTPSDPIVDKLKGQSEDVQVKVFFGSWCGACKQMVPRIMKVAEQLEGTKISFDFYGLPRGITGDPEAAKVEIHAVPTGVVYSGGKEIGRIEGSGWRVPELAINNLLINPSS